MVPCQTPFSPLVSFFNTATLCSPYPYQLRLANEPLANRVMRVPTGAGKTAAAILPWLYQHYIGSETCRRLVYCLPMRVLVEQTVEVARAWISRLGVPVGVATVMGGEVDSEWELYPESPYLIVGTQDMVLSRALNRGYGMSRYRWPVHFGLLNNDCSWVCDEVQLMGDGLATTAQLAAFRERTRVFGDCPTLWMSATIDRDMLRTVDLAEPPVLFELGPEDLQVLAPRLNAVKRLQRAPAQCSTVAGLAACVAELYRSGTQTLIVVNTVARAREIYDQIRKNKGIRADCQLIHGRFRPADRAHWASLWNGKIPDEGRILVSTQVIEAGLDISSSLLITDLAPWPSLVQRFGRCNRAGEFRGSPRLLG